MNLRHLPLLVLLALVMASPEANAQVLQLQPLTTFGTNGDGSIRPGERTYLTTGNTRYQRGMAYNPVTGHLLVASHALVDDVSTNVTPYIAIIDAATGADLGSLDLSSLSIGADAGFDINMVVVADDGAIYACNMSSKTTSTGSFVVYRWQDESSPQSIIYFGDPSNSGSDGNTINNRWGDTLAVRGSGLSTELLVSSRGTMVADLTPDDISMTSFSSTRLVTDAPVGDLGYGLAFGSGNTFWAKAASTAGNPLYLMSYDTGAGTATTLHKYSITVFPGWTGVLSTQPASNLLATLEMPPTGPANVRLYDISNTANPPVLLDRKAWVTNESINGIYSGSIVFAAGTNLYALNSDNGIQAFTVVSGPAPQLGPDVILNPVSGTASLANNAAPFIGAADGNAPLSYQWYFNTNTLISKATNSTYTVTNVAPTSFGSYYFIVTNSSGSATSGVATLSEAITFKNGVIYEPFNYSAGLPLQNLGGWVTNTASAAAQVQGCYIAPGSLSVAGLPAPAGNHYLWASNVTVRLPFGTQTNGPIYFSFAHRATNILGNTATEDPIGGFAYFTGTTLYPKIDCIWSDANHYTLGVAKGTGVSFRVADTNVFTGTDTVFIVCCFVMTNGNVGSDIAQLWVNPDPSTFGAAVPPAPNCVTNTGNGGASSDPASGVDRLSWRGTASSFQHEVDELRIGFTWAAVTPAPPIVLTAGNSGGSAVISWPANSTGWTLVSTTNLNGGTWITNTPIVVQGTNNTFTVDAPAGQQFFRLVK